MSEPLLSGRIVGAEGVLVRLDQAPDRVLTSLRAEVQVLTDELYGKVRDEFLSGRALAVRTGDTRASVTKRLRTGRWSITGTVGAGGGEGYPAAIWEAARKHKLVWTERVRTSSKGLMWWPGGGHPRKTVAQHARELAARPSLGPALSEMSYRIVERLGPIAAEVI